jgi:hypothetical protein
VCRDAVYADASAWRSSYWQSFGESALYKTLEWAYEEEYRIVVHSGFDMSQKDGRKLKYRFQDLTGIVFGARTDIEDKLKIMRFIDAKCSKEKRCDFKFFEIRYLYTESLFQIFPLDQLLQRRATIDAQPTLAGVGVGANDLDAAPGSVLAYLVGLVLCGVLLVFGRHPNVFHRSQRGRGFYPGIA